MELAVGQMQIDPGRLDRAVPGRGPGLSATMRHCLDHGSSTRPALTHLTRALIANNGPGDDPGAAHAVVSQGHQRAVSWPPMGRISWPPTYRPAVTQQCAVRELRRPRLCRLAEPGVFA